MEKFEIKRTQLSFNGTIEVGSVNIIPIQFVQDMVQMVQIENSLQNNM